MSRCALLAVLLGLVLGSALEAAEKTAEKPAEGTTYAVEIKGRIGGYYRETVATAERQGRPCRVVSMKRFLKLSLLGSDVDALDEMELVLDPGTGRPLAFTHLHVMGQTRKEVACRFEEARVHVEVRLDGRLTDKRTADLPEGGLVLAGNRSLAALAGRLHGKDPGAALEARAFLPAALRSAALRLVFEAREKIEVRGVFRTAERYLLSVPDLGLRTRFHLDPADRSLLRSETPSVGMTVYPADPAIETSLQRAEMTDTLVARTNVLVHDVRKLTYMRIEASFDAPGAPLSAADLTVPGQTFTGTVEDNRVEGVFDITARRYDGAGAPPFPPGFDPAGPLAAHLGPESDVESDHEDIRALAARLTREAGNAWEAAVRLAEWVHEEIAYEIPGGGTALGTLQQRKGECGGHARLHTALCRAAGIPARVVTGAMYTPLYGGSFGQHAWAEVFMGAGAGWIPIDATVGETSYADAGHIRLGRSGFRPGTLTVLAFRPRPAADSPPPADRPLPLAPGRRHVFAYRLNGTPVGREVVRLQRDEDAEGGAAVVLHRVFTASGVRAETRAVLRPDGRPLSCTSSGTAMGSAYEVTARFDGRQARVAVRKGDLSFERTVPLPERALLFDNNNLGLFSLLLSRFALEPGRAFRVHAFHPSSLSVHELAVKVGRTATVTAAGEERTALEVEVSVAGAQLRFLVTASGLILRDEEAGGRLVVVYEGEEKEKEKEKEEGEKG